MIELRKYKRMHVYCERERSSKRTHIYDLVRVEGGGACLRDKNPAQ